MKATRLTSNDLPLEIKQRANTQTFFGSTGFAGLWRAVGGRDIYWVVESGGKPIALLPSVEFGVGPARRLQVMPDGCYSRITIMSDSPPDRQKLAATLLSAMASAKYSRLWIYDYFREFADLEGFTKMECETTLVDISTPDWLPPDKKLQSEIRKAEREGVEAVELDINKHLDQFLHLMSHTEKRHGRRGKYRMAFFEALAELAQTDDRIYWPLIEAGGEAAASHIYFVEGDMVLNWQVYFDKRFSYLKPNQYLLYTTARRMASRGVGTLNLGASPDDADSLKAYKEKWGGTGYRYRCYHAQSGLGKIL